MSRAVAGLALGEVGAKRTATLSALILMLPSVVAAQQPARPIQDNSFLIEEAYNQEPGVVQHISFFTRDVDGAWQLSFTQEWPVGGLRHQLSYTLLVQRAEPSGSVGLGDAALSYRFQVAGDGDLPLAIAPRLTMLIPTGRPARELGAGHLGIQGSLPVSWVVSRRLVTHWNAGVTYIPAAHNPGGDQANTTALNLGQSTIWLALPNVNLTLETVWSRGQVVVGPGLTARTERFAVCPGIRWALNRPGGLQIVPGLALPIGVGPSRGSLSFAAYLSVEHPYKRAP